MPALDRYRWLAAAFIAAVIAVYAGLHGIYRPENVDDAWTLSFVWNYLHHGIEGDVIFGSALVPGGQNGVELFGKLHAWVYGPLLNLLGWSRGAAHGISTLLMILAAVGWGLIAHRLTGNRRLAVFMGLAILWMEPFFAAANQARPDALTFLFLTLSLLAYLGGRPFAAGLAAVAAFETHPMGAMTAFYLLAAWLARHGWRPSGWRDVGKEIMFLAVGIIVGLAVYAALHVHHLRELPAILLQGNTEERGGYLYRYFFTTRYRRHLPELILAVLSVAVFLARRQWREKPFLGWAILTLALSLVVLRRPNFHYAIYPYPLFVLLALFVAERLNRLWVLLVVLLALLLPQYAMVYRMNRHIDVERDLRVIQAGVPEDSTPVVGNANNWFVLKERTFYATEYPATAFRSLGIGEFYLVENESFRKDPRYAGLREFIAGRYTSASVTNLPLSSGPVTIRVCRRNP